MRALTAIVLALVMLLCPNVSVAETGSGDPKVALEKFKQAQKAFDSKDYERSLEFARAALEATGSPNARLYVARALRELGKLPEAFVEMERTLRDASESAKTDTKYQATRDSAAAELALLDQRVAKVVVALAEPPPGVKVELNGRVLSAPEVGQPLPVDAGEVVVRAMAEGAAPIEKRVKIAAGATQTVTLVFREEGQAAPAPTETTDTKPLAPKKEGGSLRTAGYVLAGVGVAGLAVFAITGSMANSKFSELEDECGSKRCTDPKYGDTVDSGKRLETIANIGLVAGGVGLLAGGALIVFGGSKEQPSSARVQGTPGGGLSLSYARRF
ncbi:MAG: hypothetical protein IPI67_04130 [Myxococcales bacterium]|nr:hypothetical protein [Myxococcales bacterium]